MHNLDPRQTACFLAAIRRGTIRAAADQLALEPSTISRNISALEQGLAMTLMERGRSGVRPTEAGLLLLAFLDRQDGAWELLRSDFDALASMKRGKVSVAVGEGFVGNFFDSALAKFSAKYPDITFALTVGSTEHVVQQITDDFAHLGLAYNVMKAPQLRVEMSSAQPLVAVVRRGGRFDTGTRPELATLARMPCAISPKTFGIGAMIAAAEARHGIRFRALVETGSIAALKAFVQNDMGYTILPRFVVESELLAETVVAYPLSSAVFAGGVSALLRKEGRKLPQAAQLLVKHLKAMPVFAQP